MRKNLLFFLCLVLAMPLISASAQRPIIYPVWTNAPPNIDGTFSPAEWPGPPQIVMFNDPNYPIDAYAYFMYNNTRLFVLVDAVGDGTDGTMDECLLVFNFTNPIQVRIMGNSSTAKNTPYVAAIGYGSSPSNSSSHKIYEFSIPFSYINAVPGQALDFCSPDWKTAPGVGGSIPYDDDRVWPNDNVWPYYLVTGDIETWGIMLLGGAVGGEVVQPNFLAVMAPWMVVVLAVVSVSISIVNRKRRLNS